MQIIRRRKKKKKLNETELCQDIDSGYLNGPESSSELTSETELLTGKTLFQKEKTLSSLFTDKDKNLIKDISTDDSQSTISFEFGDVKEILEELAIAKTFHDQIFEDTENVQKVMEIELRNNQQGQLKPELEIKVPIEEDVNSEFDSKSQSVLISHENKKIKTFESENNYKLSVTATLSEKNTNEALCPSDRSPINEKSTKCKNNAKKEQKANAKQIKSSHLKSQMSNYGHAITEGTLIKFTFTIRLCEFFFEGSFVNQEMKLTFQKQEQKTIFQKHGQRLKKQRKKKLKECLLQAELNLKLLKNNKKLTWRNSPKVKIKMFQA